MTAKKNPHEPGDNKTDHEPVACIEPAGKIDNSSHAAIVNQRFGDNSRFFFSHVVI